MLDRWQPPTGLVAKMTASIKGVCRVRDCQTEKWLRLALVFPKGIHWHLLWAALGPGRPKVLVALPPRSLCGWVFGPGHVGLFCVAVRPLFLGQGGGGGSSQANLSPSSRLSVGESRSRLRVCQWFWQSVLLGLALFCLFSAGRW